MTKIAFICDTPYQLFVAMTLIFYNEDLHLYEKDLYIDVNRSKKAEMYLYYKKIAEHNIFSNVYILNSLSSFHRKLNMIEWVFPKISIRYGLADKNALNNEYSDVYISGPFMLQRNFIYCYKPKHIYFFEDGTGSYHNRIGIDMLNVKGKIMQNILKRGPEYIKPECLYLFEPQLYRGEYSAILKKLIFPNEKVAVFQNIFMYNKNSLYSRNKLVYLSQPLSELLIKKDESILSVLNDYSDCLVVRPHPQDYDKLYGNLNIDTYYNLWELVCVDSITESHILIGKYSTAQITPKLIFNKEPHIVFTHYLYDDTNHKIEEGIYSVQNLYKNKNKIHIPKTIEDLKQTIEMLCRKESQIHD